MNLSDRITERQLIEAQRENARLRRELDEAWKVAARRRQEARRYYVAWSVARMRAQALRRLQGGAS